MESIGAYYKLYGYHIRVFDTKYRNGDVIEYWRWEGLPFHVFMRFNWYFEYRYALLRVKYPKNYIYHGQFTTELTEKAASDFLKNKITAKKRKITEYKNKLSMAEKSWQSFFPISEDALYIKAAGKIARLEVELGELERQAL